MNSWSQQQRKKKTENQTLMYRRQQSNLSFNEVGSGGNVLTIKVGHMSNVHLRNLYVWQGKTLDERHFTPLTLVKHTHTHTHTHTPVSYTHLDVYKRQYLTLLNNVY